VIKYNPKYAVGYRTIGWLKRSSGQYDEALQWARKSLELAPTDLETLLLLSLIHMDEKRFTVAISTLQRAIELGPDYGRAYYNLGTVYMKLGVLEAALENFLQAIKFKGDPNCYIDAGYICLVTGDLLGARQRLEESIAAGYMSFVSHYMLGYVAGLQGDTVEAQWQFRHVLELTRTPDGSPTTDIHQLGYQALAHAGLGERQAATDILEALEPKATNSGEVLADIARAWAVLGEHHKAQRALHQAFAAHAGPTEKEIAPDPHFAALND
jgi:Flp pilus assembly protein TadD